MTPGELSRAAVGRGWVVVGGLVGLAAFIWLVPLQLGWYVRGNLGDVGLYRDAARRMAVGELPYRDFALEYPPGAAGLFLAAWPWPGAYSVAFSGLMLAALIVTAVAVFATARALGFSDLRAALSGGAVAVAPPLLGSFVEARFDLALSAALAVALYGAVTRRFTIAWGALALGVLIKLVPLALIPVLLVYHAHVRGVRRAMTSAAVSLGVVAVVFVPFLVAAPGGTLDLARYHLERPLQIESAGSAALLALDQAGVLGLEVTTSFGSQNLVGAAPSAIAMLSSAVLVGLLCAIAVSLFVNLRGVRAPADARLFVVAALATLIALLVAGKVLSPQFLVWLLPAAFLVPGQRGRWVAGLAGLAFLLTQAYFTALYWDLVDLSSGPVALLVLRDLTLAALLVAAWPRSATVPRTSEGDVARQGRPMRSLALAALERDP